MGQDVGRGAGRDLARGAGPAVGRGASRDLVQAVGQGVSRDAGRDLGKGMGQDMGKGGGQNMGRDAGQDVGLVEAKLKELGLELPAVPKPAAAYVPAVRSGNLVFVSGQTPTGADGAAVRGKVGQDLTVEQGYDAARLCALKALAVVKQEVGSLDRIRRIVKVLGWVNCPPEFEQQPRVMNGFSELMEAVLGDKGKHARSAIGTNALPGGVPVEVEMVVEIES